MSNFQNLFNCFYSFQSYRYSPHIEDDLPHELSAITEVDTPVTSRLNGTDMTIVNESPTIPNNSVKLAPDDNAFKFDYKTFPNFKDYVQTNVDISQLTTESGNDTINTTGLSVITDEKLTKLLEPMGSKVDDLKYKTFEGERPDVDSRQLEDSELRLSYAKFPPHSEYAKSVTGLLDSQTIDRVDISDGNSSTASSLPDIVNELKSRNILEHSFKEADGDDGNLDDLLMVHGKQNESKESLTDGLEKDLHTMGLSWVSTELRKSKAISTTQSSDDSSKPNEKPMHTNNYGQSHRQLSPVKSMTAKRTFQKMNHSKATNDSFVDKNLMATGTIESNIQTQPSDSEPLAKPINLKDFLSRELLKHSSMSSSSNSSLNSIFLKSLLGQSSGASPATPPNRGIDKHRTSTPVDHSSEGIDSSGKQLYRTSTIAKESSKTETPTFFSNESQLSSVRMSTPDSTTDERNK